MNQSLPTSVGLFLVAAVIIALHKIWTKLPALISYMF